jgi:hypothetical protein
MADWRQIQARIRKAKNSPDAQAKLNELFQRTRDGMVAWELGVIEEKAEHLEEAGRWYTIAAQRFRRADWRKKAEEALTRLGMELPAPLTPNEQAARTSRESAETAEAAGESPEPAAEESEETEEEAMPLALGEIAASAEEAASPAAETSAAADGSALGKKKRRRGRRGGRGRRRKGGPASPGLPSQAYAAPTEAPHPRPEPQRVAFERPVPERQVYEQPRRAAEPDLQAEAPMPQLPSERAAHGRGDPALASRMAHLESLLRRLVTSPLHRLDEADEAPAGPGVFLLSDSDQITSYYVEACQTLRIGAGNLARGGRSAKNPRGGRGFTGEVGLKAKLAEYLGINEAKVSQYMRDHCVLRWIQLDDEAPLLAHFAIGVLRTPLNLD